MNCDEVIPLSPLYRSGELDPDRAAAFAAHLGTCAACELDLHLREAVLAEPVETAALDRRIRQQITLKPRHTVRWLIAAAAVAAAIVIAILFLRTPRVYADAAEDHRLEVVERQHRSWLSSEREVKSLAEQHGVAAPIVSDLAPGGYRLDCGKMCRLDGRAFLHLVYTNGAERFSVFLRPRDSAFTMGSPAETAIGSEHVALVESSQFTAFVVTDQPREATLRLARLAANVLRSWGVSHAVPQHVHGLPEV